MSPDMAGWLGFVSNAVSVLVGGSVLMAGGRRFVRNWLEDAVRDALAGLRVQLEREREQVSERIADLTRRVDRLDRRRW